MTTAPTQPAMTEAITIRIPATPSRALSPNHSREMHWRHAYDARQALKQATKAGLCNSANLLPLSLPTPVTVYFTVAWEKRRKTMDGDNLLASLKACIDTIAGYFNVCLGYFPVVWRLRTRNDKFSFTMCADCRHEAISVLGGGATGE